MEEADSGGNVIQYWESDVSYLFKGWVFSPQHDRENFNIMTALEPD